MSALYVEGDTRRIVLLHECRATDGVGYVHTVVRLGRTFSTRSLRRTFHSLRDALAKAFLNHRSPIHPSEYRGEYLVRNTKRLTMAFWLVMATTLAAYAVKLLKIVRGLDHLRPGDSSDEPTISVIVPARNEEDTIRRCLDCLLKQDYPSCLFEIIVVDDRFDLTGPRYRRKRFALKHSDRSSRSNRSGSRWCRTKKHAITRGIRTRTREHLCYDRCGCIQPPDGFRE